MNIRKGLKEIKDSRGADKPDNKMEDWVMRNLLKNEMIKMINKQSSREEVLKAVKVSGFSRSCLEEKETNQFIGRAKSCLKKKEYSVEEWKKLFELKSCEKRKYFKY